MLFSSLSVVPTALLSRSGGFRAIATREMLSAALGGLLSIGLAFSGWGPYSLVAQTLVTSVFSMVFLWSSVPWRPRWTFDREAFRDLLGYGLPLAGSNLVNFAARNVDSLLIGRFLGAAALGVYGLAYSFVMLFMNTAYSVVGRVLFPRLSRLQGDDAATRREYITSVRELATLAYLPLALAFTLAPDVVRLVLGERWGPAVFPVQVFALVAMGQLVGTTAGWIYNARARTRLQFLVGLAVTLLVIIGVSAGLTWGLRGVALGYLGASYLGAYPFLRIPYRLIGLRIRTVLAALAPVVLAAVAAGATSYAVRQALLHLTETAILVRLALAALVGTASYAAVVIALRPTLLAELREVAGALRRRPAKPGAP
jgi:PST family polysaccharide transporter